MWFLSHSAIRNHHDEVGTYQKFQSSANVTLGQGDLWVSEVAVWPLVIQDQRRVNPVGQNPGQALPLEYIPLNIRADSRIAATQWDMVLFCNDVSHWLGAIWESALNMLPLEYIPLNIRADSRIVPIQWETALLCKNVSHYGWAQSENQTWIYTQFLLGCVW